MIGSSNRRKHRLNHTLLGILSLYLLMCITTATVLGLAAQQANRQSTEESLREVQGYLDERRNNLESQVLIYAYWEDGIDNLTGNFNTAWADIEMGQYIIDDFGINLWFVLNPQADAVIVKQGKQFKGASSLAITPDILRQLLHTTRSGIGPPPKPVSEYINIADTIYVIAAAALIIESRPVAVTESWALAFGRPLEQGVFDDIAKLQGIALRLSSTPSNDKHMLSRPLYDNKGEVLAWVEWNIELAGDRLLSFITPWVALVFALGLVLCVYLLRRVAGMHDDLSHSERRFRDAIEALPEGFVIYDAQDKLEICNANYRKMYPLSAPAITPGASFEQILHYGYTHGQYRLEDHEGNVQDIEQCIAERLAHHQRLSGTFEQQLNNGRWLRVVERRMGDNGIVSFRSDITDLKLREHELIEAKLSAERANDAKTRFLATVSHEVRTPLNAMLGFLELLQQSSLTSQAHEQVSIARRSGDQLLALIDNLLDYSRMESAQVDLELHRIDPQQLLHNVQQMLQPMARQRKLKLELDCEQALPEVTGDESRLRQVLLNLVCNALKYTDNGSVTLHAHSGASDDQQLQLEIAITDTGIGMQEDQLHSLLQPFNQGNTKGRPHAGGVGLGLPISQKILQAMGSQLRLSSTPGEGSRFSFSLQLPLAGKQARESDSTSNTDITPTVIQLPAMARVLVADDVITNQLLLQGMLKGTGYEVTLASNGCEAVAQMAAEPFDVILMDIEMPELDGIDATRLIRRQSGHNTIPIIAVTASAMKGDRERFLAAGMNDYLSKPLRKSALMAMLAHWSPISNNPEPGTKAP